MATLTIETLAGDKAEFAHAQGMTFPAHIQKMLPYGKDIGRHLADVKHMEIRDDDWYLVTFPKCGTHWGWEIMSMLQRGTSEHDKRTKETVFLDLRPISSIDVRPSPRILNGHLPVKLTPRGMFEKKTKIVHVMRNPKDAFVSMYYHFKGISADQDFVKDFKTFFQFVIGTYGIQIPTPFFDFIRCWERFTKDHPDQIINLFYEDIKEDPVREIKKMNEFLGTKRDDKLIQEIADACSFDKMKKADAEIKEKEGPMKKATINMYRKGEVGDWKNHFTVDMNEQMDEWIRESSVGCSTKFRYTL